MKDIRLYKRNNEGEEELRGDCLSNGFSSVRGGDY